MKLDRASGTCETIAEGHICISRFPERDQSVCDTEKMFKEILAINSKFGRRHMLTDSRSSKNSKKNKFKVIVTQIY